MLVFFGYKVDFDFSTITDTAQPGVRALYRIEQFDPTQIGPIVITDGFGPIDDQVSVLLKGALQQRPDILLVVVGNRLFGPYDVETYNIVLDRQETRIQGRVDRWFKFTVFSTWNNIREQVRNIVGVSGDVTLPAVINEGTRPQLPPTIDNPFRYWLDPASGLSYEVITQVEASLTNAGDLGGLRTVLADWGLTIAPRVTSRTIRNATIPTVEQRSPDNLYLDINRLPLVSPIYPTRTAHRLQAHPTVVITDGRLTQVNERGIVQELNYNAPVSEGIIVTIPDEFNLPNDYIQRKISIRERLLTTQPVEIIIQESGTVDPPIELSGKDESNLARAQVVVDIIRWTLQNSSVTTEVDIQGNNNIVPSQLVTFPRNTLPYGRVWRTTAVKHTITPDQYITTLSLALHQGLWRQGPTLTAQGDS